MVEVGARSLAAEARAALRSGHFIDGARVPAAAGASAMELINPATGEHLHTVHEATPQQVEAAVQSARRALHGVAASGSFRSFTDSDRAGLLSRIADQLAARREHIAA
jgi:acyl-CoA reductase-like NAD-dependent aldehyde dehydrogenase